MKTELFAFLLTLFAGLATGIGSLAAMFAKKTNTRFLAVSLGFSAGVMIYVSMIEIYQKASDVLSGALGEKPGLWVTAASFFGGMLLIGLIDKLIPSEENPHELRKVESMEGEEVSSVVVGQDQKDGTGKERSLMRMGMMMALALGIHNFPEGLATFISGLQDISIAVPIAFAIAIHNIPEGIAVSVPIYFATGNRRKAFIYSFLSGLTEPLGAVIGYTILRPGIVVVVFGVVFAMVAGIMVFISLDELLPSAREYGEHHLSIYGLVGGMALMAVSLLLFLR
jgi:ZIP family zinc transporter